MVVRKMIYECEKCGCVYGDYDLAEECCSKRYCDCGKEIDKYYTKCRICTERKRFKNANKVKLEDYKGEYLYDDPTNKYFSGIDELVEYYEDLGAKPPKYAYGCTATKFSLDISDIVQNELNDNHYEDAYDNVEDEESLVKFVNEWTDKQNIVSYYQDTNTIVIFGSEVDKNE